MSKVVNILWTWLKLIMQFKGIITQIKAEEFKIADRENKISDSAAQVSVAT